MKLKQQQHLSKVQSFVNGTSDITCRMNKKIFEYQDLLLDNFTCLIHHRFASSEVNITYVNRLILKHIVLSQTFDRVGQKTKTKRKLIGG